MTYLLFCSLALLFTSRGEISFPSSQIVYANKALGSFLETSRTCHMGFLLDNGTRVALCTLSSDSETASASRLLVEVEDHIKELRNFGDDPTSDKLALAVAGWRADRLMFSHQIQRAITDHCLAFKQPASFKLTINMCADFLNNMSRSPSLRPLVVSCLAAGISKGSAYLCQISNDGSASFVRVGFASPLGWENDMSRRSELLGVQCEIEALVSSLQCSHTEDLEATLRASLSEALKKTAWPHIRHLKLLSSG